MKFATKLSIAIMLLLSVSLSTGGYFLVRQNFQDSMEITTSFNINQHLMERYSLEADLLSLQVQREKVTDDHLQEYGEKVTGYIGKGQKMLAIYNEKEKMVYSNTPPELAEEDMQAALDASGENYYLKQAGERQYMLVSSKIVDRNGDLWLLSVYDMSPLFMQRSSQMRNLWTMEIVVLTVALVAILVMSQLMTRPIRKLSVESKKIASGAYSARTGVNSKDEIGELARNFDEMAVAVEERVAELGQLVQKQDDFISAFTHEIKTPMTSIIGYADLMRTMDSDAQTRQKSANYIYHEAKRLEALSQKLLILMGLSDEEIRFRPVRLSYLFTKVTYSLADLPQGIQLDTGAVGEMTVRGDQELLCDLLRNLILNAAKAEPTDGRVTVGAHTESDSMCCLFVQDKGRGIPQEELSRIIEPFYMVDKSRARESGGSGIGLALCNEIVRLHEGKLAFESEVGEGTLVKVSLPLWGRDTA